MATDLDIESFLDSFSTRVCPKIWIQIEIIMHCGLELNTSIFLELGGLGKTTAVQILHTAQSTANSLLTWQVLGHGCLAHIMGVLGMMDGECWVIGGASD